MDSSDYFETNKSGAALARESEEEIVREGGPGPVDLREIPRERWDEFIHYQVTLPPSVAAMLDGEPIPGDQVDAFELAVEAFHSVASPYYIAMCPILQTRGRPWAYVPAVAPYVTGFRLLKE
ncbi:MAG: hypothetical protein QOE70_5502 [Chthoniobacter sp.]|jgi:hypothetical protein|nr:hypothetical protein [Chthoniobacter sp.]